MTGRGPWRWPPLTSWLVRSLVIAFGTVVLWRLVLLALDTYEVSRFSRPPVAPRQAVAATPAPTNDGIAAMLHAAALPEGSLAVYVSELSTAVGGALNAERRFPAASLFKLPIMVEVLKQQRLRRFAWSDTLVIGREHWTDGTGVLQARVGQSLRIDELTQLMIAESDNIAANVLVDHVGVANVNATLQALGLRSTRIVDRFRENLQPTTSAEDMGRLLGLIATGRLIDARTSEEAVRLLELRQAQSWLGEGLPWWGKLAHKWGDLPNARHDVGIIYTPRHQIVLVVLTENANAGAAAELIRGLSRQVVGYFEGPGA